MDPRLQKAIGAPRILGQADQLVTLALRALDDLKRLDESLYERFVHTRDAALDREASGSGLRALWDATFGGLRALLAYCRSLESERQVTAPVEAPVSFDFGDLEEGAAHPAAGGELELGSSDIGDLLGGLDEHEQEGDAERWAKVIDKVLSIEYGLRSQETEAITRRDNALAAGEVNQVLGLLDDTQSSASEGVHALVTAIYDAFVPDQNPATVVPGYLTALGRALLVRRGLAELSATLAPYNESLQGTDPTLHAPALETIRAALKAFVGSVVCRAMRAADRWQVVEFERDLASQPLAAARMTSEGLVKYLDSLGSINQREVLMVHDQRALEQMRESLANARQLVDLSPRTALEMMDRAYQAAQRLRGRSTNTDQLVVQLERYAPTSSAPAESVRFLERLEAVLAAAGG